MGEHTEQITSKVIFRATYKLNLHHV